MTQPRHRIVCLEQTAYYHCVSRCVRRAFLCGRDQKTGKDFSHRRGWIEARLKKLSACFAIDILAYAVMSNHYHLVLRIDRDKAEEWTDDEVEARWSTFYKLPTAYQIAKELDRTLAMRQVREKFLALWRDRLSDLGWFMRTINEPLARFANREDDCTGRFWEGRYRSQALLDEAAVLKCMAYVDLNPIRAGVARTPACSRFTSICARLKGDSDHLAGFEDREHSTCVPARYAQYLALVDWTGRIVRDGRRSSVTTNVPSIVKRLDTKPRDWIKDVRLKKPFRRLALGSPKALLGYRVHLRQQWIVGTT